MIIDYSPLQDLTHERCQEFLQEVEAESRYKQLKRNYRNRLRQMGQYLADAMKQLTVHSQSNPATPTFGEK